MIAEQNALAMAADIVRRVRQVVGESKDLIPLHIPEFSGREWDLVKDCLDTGWVSYAGGYVDRFERELAASCGVDHAVAVVNGTVALHIALTVSGVNPGDEVLLPSLTFVATANAVSHAGAVPHFVDSCEQTLGLDPHALQQYLERIAAIGADGAFNRNTGRRIAAVVPMHTFGFPVDMDPLIEVCAEWKIPIVEDSTESLGSSYKGRPCGSFGRMGTLSFNGNKIITTGGGGALLTNDEALARRAKHLTTTAKVPHRWAFFHDEIAYNFRLPNLNAALGCAQMEQLPERIASKRRLAEQYAAGFEGLSGATIMQERPESRANYWLSTLLLDNTHADSRDTILTALNDDGLMARPIWTLMHRLPMYANAQRAELPVAESLEARIINLPSSAYLASSQ